MKLKTILLLFLLLPVSGFCQQKNGEVKKVAILEVVDKQNNIDPGIKLLLRGSLAEAVSHTPGYEAYDRNNLDKIMQEEKIQSSGLMNETTIQRLGRKVGASYILVVEAAYMGAEHGSLAVLANMTNVETAQITTVQAFGPVKDLDNICNNLTYKLFGIRVVSDNAGSTSPAYNNVSPSYNPLQGQDINLIVDNIRFTMKYVEGGYFIMGCTAEHVHGTYANNEMSGYEKRLQKKLQKKVLQGLMQQLPPDCEDIETPAHRVKLSDYYIGETEVTVEQFAAFVNATNYQTDADKYGGSYIIENDEWVLKPGVSWLCDAKGNYRSNSEYRHPVIHVSRNDAMAYCRWLSQETGKTFTLPTEAQWEYAARGGKNRETYKYAGSDSIGDVAWYDDNAYYVDSTHPDYGTHTVKTKSPNSLGIYDMSGNVYEWCSDWYDKYSGDLQNDPTGPSSGWAHVLRGGSWDGGAYSCRNSSRNGNSPDYRNYDYGFRLVLLP